MSHFPKPEEGSWTEHYGLGTAPMSYEDSISPEHYDLEREAIFERSWLNVGRINQLRNDKRRYTQDIVIAEVTVLIIEDTDGTIAACRFPIGEDPSTADLTPVQVDVWEGFIFVNLDDSNTNPLRESLGKFAAGLEGFPFGELTQRFTYRSEVGSNWKLYIDAFAEFYHAPVLHSKQYVTEEAQKLQGYGFEALHYDVDGPHGMVSSWGGMAPPKDPSMVKPIERILRSGNFGPWDKPDIPGLADLPTGLNPARHPSWGLDSYVFFPNFMLVMWEPGWFLTYHYWPTAYNRHIFEGTMYMAPPRNATDRLRQEIAAVTFKEFALQDSNTLEATQKMLETRVVSEFPLCDQEILLRHLHSSAQKIVDEYRATHTPATASAG
ncbi:aromatic ring-hydroxylating dioxygenase subunit alpha [Rhodococcus sp. HNM0563]|uniref:SRPBCC family protein n=1 Tax=Rhodococcus sp. HNM0563 TaxID=2716339 RepID=UPI00146C3055|nr:SRPBCC family protein [Rhodococcus sp. HNM0563]NLU63976.1 aromatic ring-hydroxylating dioxygenase subunit alpha [Rhodococcus sp. HNM0563]